MKRRTVDYSEQIQNLTRWKTSENAIEATFQVTSDCSLRCTYCYQGNKHPGKMSFETGKKFIDVLFRDLSDKKQFVILDFIGGEPLLMPTLIKDLYNYWRAKCVLEENWTWAKYTRVSICTNGTEWNKPEVQDLLDTLGDNLSLTVTIDGDEQLHDSARKFPDGRGSYSYAINAANDFETKHNIQLGSKITLAPSNIIFTYSALKHYMESGKEEIFCNQVYENVWKPEDATLLYSELKRVSDFKLKYYPDIYISILDNVAGKPIEYNPNDDKPFCGGFSGDGETPTMIACDIYGQLFPCQRYTEISISEDTQPPLTIGDIETGIDFEKIKSMGILTRSSMEANVKSLFDENIDCMHCPVASGCGNCAALCYQEYGLPIKKTNYTCMMHVARCLAISYYWNSYYKQINSEERVILNVPKYWALQIISEEEYNMLKELEK